MLAGRLSRGGRKTTRLFKGSHDGVVKAAATGAAQKGLPQVPETFDSMDGNTAAAYVAYAMSEVSFIYPISPATSMGELMDQFASAGIKNVVTDRVVDVEVMQSEGGAAGACHGALHGGSLASTFTASQGLLLMIPNLYLIAGELIPTVFHISARTVAKHALSIYNDHSDVMACRQTGWAMLASNDAQEVMDLGLVAHMATLRCKVPFMHFFDGNRTSGEIKKIKRIPYESIKEWVPRELITKNLRNESLNPQTPLARGVGQRPDVFMQHSVSSQKFYEAAPGITQTVMDEFAQMTGRQYNLFDYFGDPNAERVIICMGSAAMTIEQVVDNLNKDGKKVGVMSVRLYRPWSAEHFLEKLPKTAKTIAVLDKTREDGALGNPLFLDSSVSVMESDRTGVKLIGGQYGLSSKEFTPPMIEAIYEELAKDTPKKRFTIGIKDDVTHSSLDYSFEKENTVPEGTTQCVFWGLGSDGTVGANKEAIKMIGENTDMYTQGHFVYDSKKSGGVTVSHLRFGKDPIRAEYLVQNADFVGCHNQEYPRKFNVLSQLKKGGIFALNTPFADNTEALLESVPNSFKKEMAELGGKFYAIDAQGLAISLGLGPRINMVMTSVFYQLSEVLPVDEALSLLKDSIKKVYGKKGDKVVKMNYDAVDMAKENLYEIPVDPAWKDLPDDPLYPPLFEGDKNPEGMTKFVRDIMMPAMTLDAEAIPVSAFTPGGVQEVGTTMFERRGFAPEIPVWKPDPCTQCNYCALVCPHGVIRPFIMDKKTVEAGPQDYKARKAQGGGELSGKQFSIQVAPMDCTGCAVCSQACPDDALVMTKSSEILDSGKTVMADQLPHWEYSFALPNVDRLVDKFTVKGSQFQQPLLEFSCACSGCGETPYAKLLTQLFGQNLVIANASGCSSVWGGTALTHPYTTHKETGRGPSWGRSLFEDNAEYGYGMAKAGMARRAAQKQMVERALDVDGDKMSPELQKNFAALLRNWDDLSGKANDTVDAILPLLEAEADKSKTLTTIWAEKDTLNPFANWLLGGDGWAYDIGFGGLAHVLSKGDNVNILVMDTEQYSNTGGQSSKSTNKGTVTKFESMGKSTNKMNLGDIAKSYGNVYVASIAMGANYNQSVQAFKEAQEYPGTSIIMAYSPCIDWGFDMQYMMDFMKTAVDTGYWQLYRYDPRKEVPMQMDSKKIRASVDKYLGSENRFVRLQREQTERADKLHTELQEFTEIRHKRVLRQSMSDLELLDFLKKQIGEQTSEKLTVLYGSETGNAAEAAEMLKFELSRRDMRAQCIALDDYDVDELANEKNVVMLIATCGQGELPANCKSFYKDICNADLPSDLLANTQISVFGLGDTHYVYFNEAAKMYENRFKELGATNFMPTVFGDDQDDDRWETAFEGWTPDLFNALKLPEPEKKLMPSSYAAEVVESGDVPERYTPAGAIVMDVTDNTKLTPETYDRDTRHYRVDIEGKTSYELGDALGVYPTNAEWKVDPFLAFLGYTGEEIIQFNDQNPDRKDPLPEFLTTKQLFTEVMDAFGKPKRRFYELLELTAEDDADREAIAHLLSTEGAADFRAMVHETVDHQDLLQKFPSCKPSLSYLLDYIPRIKPRLYSIASSPNELPDSIEMCIVVDDWNTPGGRYKEGLCSKYMTTTLKAQPDQILGGLMAKVNGGVLGEPEHDKPIILAALGTGLAPVRGIVRDRIHAWKGGEKTGPMSMFFGARQKENEYLYGDEWDDWEANYTPGFEGNFAWSRDQEHKIYIQDKIMEKPQQMYDYLVRDEGYFYACGSSAVNDLKQYVAKCLVQVAPDEFTEESAMEYLMDLQVKGKYNVESW